ncbi:MAG TPA: copper resistance CopC family protein [Gryllotalpicola sp.]
MTGAVLTASVLVFAPATAASAHDYLVSSTPAANATVTSALPRVTLVFDDVVLDENGRGALVQVTDASGRNYEAGCAEVQGRDVSVPVALGAAGGYRVTWQIVSADGHPVSASIQFAYHGPAAGQGHAGPLTKCGTKVQAPAAQGPGASAPTASGISTTTLIVLIVAGAVVLLVLVAVVLIVLLAGRRRGAARP